MPMTVQELSERLGGQLSGDASLEISASADADPELANPTAKPALMRQIAELGGGRYATLDTLPAMLDQLDLAPTRYRWSQHVPLWDGWAALSLLVVLLTAEWVLRKWLYLP